MLDDPSVTLDAEDPSVILDNPSVILDAAHADPTINMIISVAIIALGNTILIPPLFSLMLF